MQDNTCVCCGRIIPKGRHICLSCGDYDDMQTFKPSLRANYPEPYVPPKKTNGDRIRSMNNNEIANTIGKLFRLDCFTETALFNWLEREAEL